MSDKKPGGQTHPLPIRFDNLTREQRVFYRGIRVLGFSRHDANMILLGVVTAQQRTRESLTMAGRRLGEVVE